MSDRLDFEQRQQAAALEEWVADAPEEAAFRIVALEAEVKQLTMKAADWQEVAKNENERRKAAEAEVERLERYLFAARAGVTTLESELKAVSASRDVYAEEVGRLAHKLAALAGEGDE